LAIGAAITILGAGLLQFMVRTPIGAVELDGLPVAAVAD
jgi:hypothetical protein